ncbi:hypothetical protein AQUCO_01400765v1 [Aquilegia coerulea]|uniref:F-box domain-containing protein n=1 Tax=Aquilegia coerulea TaxID=218851 RepID=A0A2G5DXY6_AQUCA|nr:hypothetical protein AQUCO_01400765v1 [Aquilegia coerulea]
MNLCEFTDDIIIEILLRTPAKDLVTSKTVCKRWYNIISDSSFVNTHLHHSNNCRSRKGIILKPSGGDYWRLDEYSTKIDRKNMSVEKFNLNIVIPGKKKSVSIIASCNGLLLLRSYSGSSSCHGKFYICNLVTRESTALPRINDPRRRRSLETLCVLRCKWAFSYDTSVERYKVFAIWREHVIMLTSGDKKWINISFPTRICKDYPHITPPVFAERELHWVASQFRNVGAMSCACSLDVESREFREIELPIYNAYHYAIFAPFNIKGSISVTIVFDNHLEIWSLAHKANNQWTQNISVSFQSFLKNTPYSLCNICIVGMKEDIDSNDISDMKLKIFIPDGDKLLYHDLSGELRQIASMNNELIVNGAYQFHIDSLVSWNPAQAKRKRKRRRSAEHDRTTTRDCNQAIPNDYIELRNKRRIPRRGH